MVIFNALGHLIIGSLTGLAVTHNSISFMCYIFGSLLPDIDTRYSTLGKYNPLVRWMTHRGHCHSFLGLAFIALPFLAFGLQNYEMTVLAGFIHILSDKFLSWLPKKKEFKLRIW